MNIDREKVHQLIEQDFIKSQVTGLVVYACADSGEIFQKAYGDHDRETNAPLTPDVYFPIASHTKTITAAAVLHLRDQKLLRLDEKLVDIVFPENQRAKIRRQYPALKEVTVDDMLRHRTPMLWDDTVFDSWERANNPAPYPSKEDFGKSEIFQLMNQKMLKDGAEKPEYSNAAYALLGKIIEIRSGQPFGEYAHENILKPTELKPADFGNIHIASTQADIEGMNIPTGYYETKGQLHNPTTKPVLGSCAPSGGAYAKASDIGNFYHALMNGKIFPPNSQSFKDMTSFIKHGEYDNGEYNECGMGLFKHSAMIGIGHVIGHEGSITGYRSMTFYNDVLKTTVTAFLTSWTEGNQFEQDKVPSIPPQNAEVLPKVHVSPNTYVNHVFQAVADAQDASLKNDSKEPSRSNAPLMRPAREAPILAL